MKADQPAGRRRRAAELGRRPSGRGALEACPLGEHVLRLRGGCGARLRPAFATQRGMPGRWGRRRRGEDPHQAAAAPLRHELGCTAEARQLPSAVGRTTGGPGGGEGRVPLAAPWEAEDVEEWRRGEDEDGEESLERHLPQQRRVDLYSCHLRNSGAPTPAQVQPSSSFSSETRACLPLRGH